MVENPRHVLVIYNPSAKAAADPDNWLGVIIHRLCEESDCIVTIRATRPDLDGATLLGGLDIPLNMVIAAGGDGTVRQVVTAVADTCPAVPIGIIPVGTGNHFARNLRIYEDNLLSDPLEHAMKIIQGGVVAKFDLGRMNGHYFTVAAGAGPMSDAVILPGREDKSNWKMLAYASSMIQTFALPPVVFRINADGDTFRVAASGVFVTNISDLGLGKLAESAEVDDGFLDLCILNPTKFTDYIEMGFRFGGGFVGGEAPFYSRRVKSVNIEVVPVRSPMSNFQQVGHKLRSWLRGATEEAPPVQKEVIAMIDGDACGSTPMRIDVLPQAIGILVPPKHAH